MFIKTFKKKIKLLVYLMTKGQIVFSSGKFSLFFVWTVYVCAETGLLSDMFDSRTERALCAAVACCLCFCHRSFPWQWKSRKSISDSQSFQVSDRNAAALSVGEELTDDL